MSAADLVREVKYRAKIDRDTKLAEMIGVGRANVSAWLQERSNPDAVAVLTLCEIADLTPSRAKELLEIPKKNYREAGFTNVAFLSSVSLGGIGVVTLSKMSLLPYEAMWAMASNSWGLYIM